MTVWTYLSLYGIAAVVFALVDLVWLGLVANNLYRDILGDLLREKPNVVASVVFYAVYIVGIIYFAVGPAVDKDSLQTAIVAGALFGFFTYATWDLTNWAVVKDWPAAIVPIDMAWGTILSGTVSTGTFLFWTKVLH